MKGQTNHAQADQRLYFSKTASECSFFIEQCSESFPFMETRTQYVFGSEAEMNIFAWWAKIVAVGSYRRIIYCPGKITDMSLTRKPAQLDPLCRKIMMPISLISSVHMKR